MNEMDDYKKKFDALFEEFEEVKSSCQEVFQGVADARRAYEIAEAKVFGSAQGTEQEKRARAEVSCGGELRKAKDDAEVLEKALRFRFSALEGQLSAVLGAMRTLGGEG